MILIVDDEPSVLAYVGSCLRHMGYTPVEANDALEAAHKFKSSGPFRLLITDIVMPGASGIVLAEEVRKLNPDLPILFVSGYHSDRDELSAWLERDKVCFLKKPFTMEASQREIKRLCS